MFPFSIKLHFSYQNHLIENSGEEFNISLRILNHSANAETFSLDLSLPDDFFLKSGSKSLYVDPQKAKHFPCILYTSEDIQSGLYVIPAKVQNIASNLSINIECCIEIR